jgi:hypothetical protein
MKKFIKLERIITEEHLAAGCSDITFYRQQNTKGFERKNDG